jgi:Abnormal spindle-like microcephaly-assoc'd, ASPM-SPD-2-Hydin
MKTDSLMGAYMMKLRDIYSCSPLRDEVTTVTTATCDLSRLNGNDAHLRVRFSKPGHDLRVLFLYVLILLCLGGESLSAANRTRILQASPNSVSFGGISLGSKASASVSLVNAGAAAVTVSKINMSGRAFSVSGEGNLPTSIAAGGKVTLNIGFSPTASGAASGHLTITSNASANETMAVSLSGTGIAASAPTLTALSCTKGSMTAAGTDSCTVTLNAVAPSGGLAVSLASNNSAVTVPASVTVASGATTASFTATVSSVSTAQTVILTASTSSVAKTFALQLGSGVPTLSINAASLSFGDVNLNTPATQSVTLSSTGTLPVTVSLATVIGTGFTVSGATFPLTLSTNQTVTISVQFDPTVAGAATGTLTVVSTSLTNPTAIIGLTGTGISATYDVNLSWDAPTGSTDPVAGYNVYRSPSGSSSYVQINTAVVTQTTYVDAAVQNGLTYDYIVESVDASGITSSPSTMAAVPIP